MLDIYDTAEWLYSLLGRRARIIASDVGPESSIGFARNIVIDQITIMRFDGNDLVSFFEHDDRYQINIVGGIKTDQPFIFEGSGGLHQSAYQPMEFNRMTMEVL